MRKIKVLGNEMVAEQKKRVNHTCATCKDGRLLVENQPEMTMEMGERNYHGIDYQLFHLDIRANVDLRVHTYLKQQEILLLAEQAK